jgi:hypothetical protein
MKIYVLNTKNGKNLSGSQGRKNRQNRHYYGWYTKAGDYDRVHYLYMMDICVTEYKLFY